MGRGATDIQDELKLFPFRIAGDSEGSESVPPASAGNRIFTRPKISAAVLRRLKDNAETPSERG
jgi:molecular chaperone DnaK/molecular chaperone HscA